MSCRLRRHEISLIIEVSFIHEENNPKKLLELFFMPLEIFLCELMNEFLSNISLKFIFKKLGFSF